MIALVVLILSPSIFGLGLCCLISAVWWAVFTIPTLLYLEPRPGPPLPRVRSNHCLGYAVFSWKRILTSLRDLKHLPHTRRYLISYFIFSDSYSAIASVGILFGESELGMTFIDLAIVAVIVPLFAAIGVYVLLWVQQRYHLKAKRMIQLCLYVLACLTMWGCIGFIDGAPVGMVSMVEMYIFGAVYGFVLGAVQVCNASFFVQFQFILVLMTCPMFSEKSENACHAIVIRTDLLCRPDSSGPGERVFWLI